MRDVIVPAMVVAANLLLPAFLLTTAVVMMYGRGGTPTSHRRRP